MRAPLPNFSHRHAQRTARKPREGDPEEDRVGRVDDGEHERGERRRSRASPSSASRMRRERERERGRDEELARRRGGQRERGERAAVPGRHRRDPDRGAGRRSGGHDPPEQRVARLVGGEHGEGRQHRRLVEHDLRRIDERDLRDQREERLPEREGVARVEPAVGELVHGRRGGGRRTRASLRTRARWKSPSPPISPATCQSSSPSTAPPPRRSSRPGISGTPRRARRANGAATSAATSEQHERERQRGVHGEDDGHRREDDPEPPGERRRRAPHPDRARRDRPRCEDETRRDARAGSAGRPSSSLDQRAHVARPEPAGGVAVHRPLLAADDPAAQDGRGAEQRPDAAPPARARGA